MNTAVWSAVMGKLEATQHELAAEVQRVEGVRAGYAAVDGGGASSEGWRAASVEWRDVQRRKREKYWALQQLSG